MGMAIQEPNRGRMVEGGAGGGAHLGSSAGPAPGFVFTDVAMGHVDGDRVNLAIALTREQLHALAAGRDIARRSDGPKSCRLAVTTRFHPVSTAGAASLTAESRFGGTVVDLAVYLNGDHLRALGRCEQVTFTDVATPVANHRFIIPRLTIEVD